MPNCVVGLNGWWGTRMAALDRPSEGLDIAVVIQTTFGVIQRNIVTFLALAAILAGIPAVLAGWLQWNIFQSFQPGDISGATAAAFKNAPGNFTVALIRLAANAILQGALVHVTASDLTGRKTSIGEGLTTGLRNFLPLIGIGIIYGLGVILGCILLIVPGLIVATVWLVAAPAAVVERTTITSAFTRSRDLTRGSRWRIFALMVLMAVLAWVIQAIFTALFGGAFALLSHNPLGLIGILLGAVLNGLIGAVGVAVLYTELRRLKDGVGVTELAAVFD